LPDRCFEQSRETLALAARRLAEAKGAGKDKGSAIAYLAYQYLLERAGWAPGLVFCSPEDIAAHYGSMVKRFEPAIKRLAEKGIDLVSIRNRGAIWEIEVLDPRETMRLRKDDGVRELFAEEDAPKSPAISAPIKDVPEEEVRSNNARPSEGTSVRAETTLDFGADPKRAARVEAADASPAGGDGQNAAAKKSEAGAWAQRLGRRLAQDLARSVAEGQPPPPAEALGDNVYTRAIKTAGERHEAKAKALAAEIRRRIDEPEKNERILEPILQTIVYALLEGHVPMADLKDVFKSVEHVEKEGVPGRDGKREPLQTRVVFFVGCMKRKFADRKVDWLTGRPLASAGDDANANGPARPDDPPLANARGPPEDDHAAKSPQGNG
ncbi:MAG: hypothetical protein U0793_34020, partial [Gemmataceae bacterium]